MDLASIIDRIKQFARQPMNLSSFLPQPSYDEGTGKIVYQLPTLYGSPTPANAISLVESNLLPSDGLAELLQRTLEAKPSIPKRISNKVLRIVNKSEDPMDILGKTADAAEAQQ